MREMPRATQLAEGALQVHLPKSKGSRYASEPCSGLILGLQTCVENAIPGGVKVVHLSPLSIREAVHSHCSSPPQWPQGRFEDLSGS